MTMARKKIIESSKDIHDFSSVLKLRISSHISSMKSNQGRRKLRFQESM